jgi:hypothetical protein
VPLPSSTAVANVQELLWVSMGASQAVVMKVVKGSVDPATGGAHVPLEELVQRLVQVALVHINMEKDLARRSPAGPQKALADVFAAMAQVHAGAAVGCST